MLTFQKNYVKLLKEKLQSSSSPSSCRPELRWHSLTSEVLRTGSGYTMIRTRALRQLLSIFSSRKRPEQETPEEAGAHLLCGLLENALDLPTAF